MNIPEKVLQAAQLRPEGSPLSSSAFRHCGRGGSVRSVLARLVAGGKLVRVARGVYARPKPSKFFGVGLPPLEAVAAEIARSTGEVIAPHGAEIARHLGLSTQVPAQVVFHTTGRTRRRKVTGGAHVHFVHAPENLVRRAEHPAAAAILALRYFGRENVTPEVVIKVTERISAGEMLRESGVPAWLKQKLAVA